MMISFLLSKLCRFGVLSAILAVCQMRVTQNATANTNRYFTGKSPRTVHFGGGKKLQLGSCFLFDGRIYRKSGGASSVGIV